MVRSMKCFSFVFDLSVSSGDRLAYSFHFLNSSAKDR